MYERSEFDNNTCSDYIYKNILLNVLFHNTLRIWVPSGWLWFSMIGYLPYLCQQKKHARAISPNVIIKMVLSALLSIVYVASVLEQIILQSHLKNELFSAYCVFVLTMILSMTLQFIEWQKGFMTSSVNFIFFFLAFFTMAIYSFKIIQEMFYDEMMTNQTFVFEMMKLTLKLSLLIAFSFADKQTLKDLTPVEKASFLSQITYFWMTRFLVKGMKKKLSEKEVPSLLESEKAEYLHQKFKITKQKLSNKNLKLADASSDDNMSLIKVLFHMYWKEMLITFSLRLLYDILIFLNPVLLNVFMTYLKDDSNQKHCAVGWVYSLLFFTLHVVLVLLDQSIFARGWKTGINVSSTLMTAIYDKLQKISLQTSENLVIINLLSTDVSIFREMIPYLFILWSGPFQTLICFIILFCYIQEMAAFCFLIIPIISIFVVISKKIEKIQNKYNKSKGNRIQLLEEMIESIKSVKFFDQEDVFLKKLKKAREEEINTLKTRVYYESVISTLGEITPQWITLLIFITLKSIHRLNSDTTEYVFVTLMALNILETNMSMYSDCIFDVIKAKESYKNIISFLKLEESSFKPDEEICEEEITAYRGSLDLIGTQTTKPDVIYSAVITNATFKDGCLKEINLKIKLGQLVAVCGNHASGKSALLYALLGQIKKESGTVCRLGKVAFTPQEPWVINDTIKMNILFGKNFHKRHFQQTLKYCCLNEDIDEETIINEKGSNLSGGQLYRINLARAVYSRPNIFLLDNPLCAVDITTARNIYNNLLGENGLLKDITRIIVTQPSAHWLPKADQIIVMDSNTIAESGTYNELLSKKGKFVHLLEQCPQNEEQTIIEKEKKQSWLLLRSLGFQQRPILQTTSQIGSKFWKTFSNKLKTKSLLKNSKISSENFNRQLSRVMYMNKKSLKITQLKVHDLSATNSNFKVSQRVFRKYLKSIGVFSLVLTIFIGILFEGFKTTSNCLFEEWSDEMNSNQTQSKTDYLILSSGSYSCVAGIFLLLFGILSTFFMAKASCKIHHSIAENVFNMPLDFFENNDSGVILLPFTDNLDDVDAELPNAFKMWIKDFLRILATTFLFIWQMPMLFILPILLIVILILISVIFVLATSVLQDFNFKFQSFLYTHFLETESGNHIIKAYNNEEIFLKKAYKYIDNYQKFFLSVIMAKRWSGFLLQFIGCLTILAACVYFTYDKGNSHVGLILTYLVLTVKCFDWVVRTASDIAIMRVSLHKIQELRERVPEIKGITIPNWPSNGEIEFLNYSASYPKREMTADKSIEPSQECSESNSFRSCLNDINLQIQPKEKIGIVGKSGSGKSSLVLALARLIDTINGKIIIDGIDINNLNPKFLRSKLTIFPQKTQLFSGNLRSNLDPEEKFSDEELKRVLSDVRLENQNLEEKCEEFSVGDKQLIGLARCILNKSKILILDECTANVCATMEERIEKIIQEKFHDCTILNIVHKLSMIKKYDKILVLDKGEVKEFDSPNILSKRKHGFYTKLKEQELKTN